MLTDYSQHACLFKRVPSFNGFHHLINLALLFLAQSKGERTRPSQERTHSACQVGRRREFLYCAALSGDRLLTFVGYLLVPRAWVLFVSHIHSTIGPLLGLGQLDGNHTRLPTLPETKGS